MGGILTGASRQPVVFRMGADPVPHKDVIVKHPDSPIVEAQANTPLPAANLFEVQRGMERKLAPNLIVLSGEDAGIQRQTSIEDPKLRSAPAWKGQIFSKVGSRGSRVPSCRAASICRSTKSSFPDAASAFICKSHSSSANGCRSAISSQYSCGERCAMASLISTTVLMTRVCRRTADIARREECLKPESVQRGIPREVREWRNPKPETAPDIDGPASNG